MDPERIALGEHTVQLIIATAAALLPSHNGDLALALRAATRQVIAISNAGGVPLGTDGVEWSKLAFGPDGWHVIQQSRQ